MLLVRLYGFYKGASRQCFRQLVQEPKPKNAVLFVVRSVWDFAAGSKETFQLIILVLYSFIIHVYTPFAQLERYLAKKRMEFLAAHEEQLRSTGIMSEPGSWIRPKRSSRCVRLRQ